MYKSIDDGSSSKGGHVRQALEGNWHDLIRTELMIDLYLVDLE